MNDIDAIVDDLHMGNVTCEQIDFSLEVDDADVLFQCTFVCPNSVLRDEGAFHSWKQKGPDLTERVGDPVLVDPGPPVNVAEVHDLVRTLEITDPDEIMGPRIGGTREGGTHTDENDQKDEEEEYDIQ